METQRDIFPKANSNQSKPGYALPIFNQVGAVRTQASLTAGSDFTIPAGNAGDSATISLPIAPILGVFGRTGSFGNSSFAFGGAAATTFDTEVAFIADQNNQGGDVSSLSNGEYMVDYETGMIYGKKADNGTTGTCTYYYLA